jgi:hypothetical protein
VDVRAPARLLMTVLVFVVTAGTAEAATWSSPVNVSSSSLFIDDPFIGYGSSGAGLALWRWQNGIGNTASFGARTASKAPSGAFGPERDAPGEECVPVVYGRDRVMLVAEDGVRGRPQVARIRVAFGRIDGPLGAARTLARDQTLGTPAAAANDTGVGAIAYVRVLNRRHVATLALRRGGRFGRPQIVSGRRGGVNRVTTAVSSRGDVVVAWEREGRIEVRIRRHGHSLGRIVRVGRGAKFGTQLRAAVAASGRVWIAWSAQSASEGGDNGPFTAWTAVSGRRSSSFSRARLLDRYERRQSDQARIDLALDARDNGFVAWTTFDGANYRARLGRADRRGNFLGFTTLSQPGYEAVVSDLATSRRAGEVIVVWSRLDAAGEIGDVVFAGYRSPDGTFSPEERVSRGDRASQPAVAFNPVTDVPTVVWSQREGPDGPGTPLDQVQTFVRAATRTP